MLGLSTNNPGWQTLADVWIMGNDCCYGFMDWATNAIITCCECNVSSSILCVFLLMSLSFNGLKANEVLQSIGNSRADSGWVRGHKAL